MKATGRTVTPDDRHVGERVRKRRREAALSQTALGDMIGLSFRQVQKYEAGLNRISVTRLEQIAAALNLPVTAFLASEATAPAADNMAKFAAMPEAAALVDAYLAIEDPAVRRQVYDLMLTLARQSVRSRQGAPKSDSA